LILILLYASQSQALSAPKSQSTKIKSASIALPNYQDLLESTTKFSIASNILIKNLPSSRKDASGDSLGRCYGKNGDFAAPTKDCYFGDKSSKQTVP